MNSQRLRLDLEMTGLQPSDIIEIAPRTDDSLRVIEEGSA